jgi:hypothetical protein
VVLLETAGCAWDRTRLLPSECQGIGLDARKIPACATMGIWLRSSDGWILVSNATVLVAMAAAEFPGVGGLEELASRLSKARLLPALRLRPPCDT